MTRGEYAHAFARSFYDALAEEQWKHGRLNMDPNIRSHALENARHDTEHQARHSGEPHPILTGQQAQRDALQLIGLHGELARIRIFDLGDS